MGYTFSAANVLWYPIGLVSQSNYRAMYNWSNYCWWGNYGQIIFRVILLMVEQGTTVSGYSWCQIFTDPTKNEHIISLFPVLCYFIK